MTKKYTKIRQFYALIGFMVIVIMISVMFAIVIYFWSQAIVNHSIKVVPDINNNLIN